LNPNGQIVAIGLQLIQILLDDFMYGKLSMQKLHQNEARSRFLA